MGYSRLEYHANKVRLDLENYFETKPAKLRDALRSLLRMMATAEVPEELGELARRRRIRGLQTHLKGLESYLKKEAHLTECLCARYKYRMSEPRARRYYRISPRTWAYVQDLAHEVDWDLGLVLPTINYEAYQWHDELEESFVMVDVVLDRRALDEMLVAVLEGYLSPKKSRRKGYEVYGISFGTLRDSYTQKRGKGVTVTRHISVMYCQPQLSADGTSQDVEPNEKSLRAVLKATETLFPQYVAIGDFHSHPYDDFGTLEESRGWTYTEGDENGNIEFARMMSEIGQPSEVTFIVGIARSSKRGEFGHYRGMENTMKLGLGDCRVIIAAYRCLESGRYTDYNIRLRLPGV